jgi:hypothetical protein
LDLSLILGAYSLVRKEVDIINFEMVYEEYKSHMQRLKIESGSGGAMDLFSRFVALKVILVATA